MIEYASKNDVRSGTHVAVCAGYDIRPQTIRLMTSGTAKRDPRRSDQHDLAPHRVYVLVLHASQRARAQSRAHNQRVNRRRRRAASREHVRAALDDLRDVLDGTTNDGPTPREEAREQVVKIGRGVDSEGRERDACLRSCNE